jgi:CheY-like chemotaxis protein
MEKNRVKIAVVEDNGMARTNMRNHLLAMGFSDINCFSHGRELKTALKKRQFDLLLMDFHLGQNKNGVEVIQDLQKDGLLKFSTSIIFVTSDRMPMIVGQIVDVHPDALVLKPYTIKSVERTVENSLALHFQLKPIFKLMDEDNFAQALETLDQLISANTLSKQRGALIKLRARLLVKLQRFSDASTLYKSVLESSDKIIWARWGLIQSSYLEGEIDRSEAMLSELIGPHLTNDKACEWLARINISKKQFVKAEEFLEKIKDGEISNTAARLKVYLLQAQDKMGEAIELLERKRDSNRNIRERYEELSFDLARCYLTIAESKNSNEREQSLQVARFLIGSAARKSVDDEIEVKRNYMNALVAVLEGDTQKANELLNREGMENLQGVEISTMTDAVKAWMGAGNERRASEILTECERKLASIDDENEKTIASLMTAKSEETLGAKRPRALKFNKEGLELYVKDKFDDALEYFYQAYSLFPGEAAFGLNLLQCMVEAQKAEHKNVRTLTLLQELQQQQLSEANDERLRGVANQVKAKHDAFVVKDSAPSDQQQETKE